MNIQRKTSYLLLILSSILPLFLYDGVIDPFAPLHSVPINEILYLGYVNDSLISSIPGFYVFGSLISLVTGILPENVIYLPIQLIPSILLFFIFFRKISGSDIIGGLLTLVYSISDISGSKFFFWMHGLGLILLFLILSLLVKKLEERNTSRNSILILISIFSLVYISYDITFQILLFLIGVMLTLLVYKRSIKNIISFFNAFLFLILVELGLSNFVYDTVVREFRSTENYFSSIDTFIFSFISSTNNNYILKDLVIVYPRSIGIISAIKYIILGISILISLIFTYKRYNKLKNFEYPFIIFYSFLFVAIGYILTKLTIGQFPIGVLFFPGLISICLIHRLVKHRKILNQVPLFALLILLILSSVNYSLYYSNDLINKDEMYFKYIEPSANWYSKYSNGVGASDIQTNNFYYMHMSKMTLQKGDTLSPIYDYFSALDPSLNIFPRQSASTPNTNVRYYILNQRLNTISIERWIVLKPWRSFEDLIKKDNTINKIYTSKDMDIYLIA